MFAYLSAHHSAAFLLSIQSRTQTQETVPLRVKVGFTTSVNLIDIT